jgi:Xaa-Pro aminopeptidase
LLVPEPGPDDDVWMGEAPPRDDLAHAAGINLAHLHAPEHLSKALAGRPAAYVCPLCYRSQTWVAGLGLSPATPDELQPIIDLRLCKDEHDLAAMRHAAAITVAAHRAALAAARPGLRESDVAAAFGAALIAHEARPSFTPIVSIHGEILHPTGHGNVLRDGALLLVDAGAEEPTGYASDVTRTWPVNGRWTTMQKQLYDTVLRAQRAAIAACVPGKRYRDVHDLAARKICEGLVEAELLRGDPADLAARGAHTLFFCHGVGHLIGLDVHDMEDFGDQAGYAPGRTRRSEFGSNFLRLDRDLAPGMAATIEPGVYLVPGIWRRTELVGKFREDVNRPLVDRLLSEHFGGIRIEETVVVRDAAAGGPEVLSAELPNDADAVAKLVGQPIA